MLISLYPHGIDSSMWQLVTVFKENTEWNKLQSLFLQSVPRLELIFIISVPTIHSRFPSHSAFILFWFPCPLVELQPSSLRDVSPWLVGLYQTLLVTTAHTCLWIWKYKRCPSESAEFQTCAFLSPQCNSNPISFWYLESMIISYIIGMPVFVWCSLLRWENI